MTDLVQVKIRVTPTQRDWIDRQTRLRQVSVSALVRSALAFYAEAFPADHDVLPDVTTLLDMSVAALDAGHVPTRSRTP